MVVAVRSRNYFSWNRHLCDCEAIEHVSIPDKVYGVRFGAEHFFSFSSRVYISNFKRRIQIVDL